jgi:zinc protease
MACLKDQAPEALALFADLALHPKFSAEELGQVRHSLISSVETATEDWAGEAFKTVRDVFYASSPYKRLPEGNTAVIDALTPSQIAAHYNTYFLDPARMVIAISGDLDPDAAEKWAQPFQAIAPHNPTRNSFSITSEPKTVVKPTEKQSATVMFAYPGATFTSPDRDTLVLLKTYLGGYSSPSGALLHETLRGKGLVYTVRASTIPGPAGGMFLITALGEPQNARAIADTIQALVENVKKGDVSDVLFNAAKDQAISGKKLDLPTVADISSHQALNEVLGVGYDDDRKFPERIGAITKDELVRVANKYLTTPTLVVLTPDAKEEK